MSRWYGSLDNRLEEGRMFCGKIEVGTGMTMYYWSDRHPYEVTKVFDQKHIMVRELDHKAAGEPYSNEWKLISNPKNKEMELMFRNNSWKRVVRIPEGMTDKYELSEWLYKNAGCGNYLTEKELEKVLSGKSLTKYFKLDGSVSFGVAEYYYDYSF